MTSSHWGPIRSNQKLHQSKAWMRIHVFTHIEDILVVTTLRIYKVICRSTSKTWTRSYTITKTGARSQHRQCRGSYIRDLRRSIPKTMTWSQYCQHRRHLSHQNSGNPTRSSQILVHDFYVNDIEVT